MESEIIATNIAIVTDTTACIPQDKVAEYAIELVPVEVIFDGQVYRDGIDITPVEFYKMLQTAKKLPTTSGASTGYLSLNQFCHIFMLM